MSVRGDWPSLGPPEPPVESGSRSLESAELIRSKLARGSQGVPLDRPLQPGGPRIPGVQPGSVYDPRGSAGTLAARLRQLESQVEAMVEMYAQRSEELEKRLAKLEGVVGEP